MELEGKRQEFWRSRRTGHRGIWLCLKQACEADEESAALILQINEIFMDSTNIQICLDTDGNRYELPVWVINNPSYIFDTAQTN